MKQCDYITKWVIKKKPFRGVWQPVTILIGPYRGRMRIYGG